MVVSAKVYLGIPTYDNRIQSGILNAVYGATSQGVLDKVQIQSGSWTTRNFNALYAAALNARKDGITHFCMLHEDIVPQEALWLDYMLAIMGRENAGMLSVIVPLKDEKGLTSTALDVPFGGHALKRLTLHEVFTDYAPTFTHEKLLLNTGCMLIDIRQEWADKLWFRFLDEIVQKDGRFVESGMSEDWDFSRRAKALGAKIYATREIPVVHMGGGRCPNDRIWGTWKADQ